jgi:hypothetical protein
MGAAVVHQSKTLGNEEDRFSRIARRVNNNFKIKLFEKVQIVSRNIEATKLL